MSHKRWFAWKPLGSHFSSCNKPEQWFYHFKVIYISLELHDTMAMLRIVAVHHLHKWHNFRCCDNHSQSLYHTYKPVLIGKKKSNWSIISQTDLLSCSTWLSRWNNGLKGMAYWLVHHFAYLLVDKIVVLQFFTVRCNSRVRNKYNSLINLCQVILFTARKNNL